MIRKSYEDIRDGLIKFNVENQHLYGKTGMYNEEAFDELSIDEKFGKLIYLYMSVLCIDYELLKQKRDKIPSVMKGHLQFHISRVVVRACRPMNEEEDTVKLRIMAYNLVELCIHRWCLMKYFDGILTSGELQYYSKTLFARDTRVRKLAEGKKPREKKRGRRYYTCEKSAAARWTLLEIWRKMLVQIWKKGFNSDLYKWYMKEMIFAIWKNERSDGNFIKTLTFLSNFVLFQKRQGSGENSWRRSEELLFITNCRDAEIPLSDILNFLQGMVCTRKIVIEEEQGLLFDSVCKRVIINFRNERTNDAEEGKKLRELTCQLVIKICDLVKNCQDLYFFGKSSGVEASSQTEEDRKKDVHWFNLRKLIISMTKSVFSSIPFHYPKRAMRKEEEESEYKKHAQDVFEIFLLPWLPKIKNLEEIGEEEEEEEDDDEDEVEGVGAEEDGDVSMKKRRKRKTRRRRFLTKGEEEIHFRVFEELHELVLRKFNDPEATHMKRYIKTFKRLAIVSTQGLRGKNDKARIPLISHATFVKAWNCTVDILTRVIPTGQTVRSGENESNYFIILFLPMHRFQILVNRRISILKKIWAIRQLGPPNQRTRGQQEEMKLMKREYEKHVPDNTSTLQTILEKWKVLLDRLDKVIGYSTLFPELHKGLAVPNRHPAVTSNADEEGRLFSQLGNFLIRLGVTLFDVYGSTQFLLIVDYNIQLSKYLTELKCSDLLNEHLRQLRMTVIQNDVNDPRKRKASETLEGYTKLFGYLFSMLDMENSDVVLPNGFPYDLSGVWKTVLDELFGAILEKRLYDENGFLWKVSPLFSVTLSYKIITSNNALLNPSPIVDMGHQIVSTKSVLKQDTANFWNKKLGMSPRRLEFPSDLKEIVEELVDGEGLLLLPSANIKKLKITPTMRENEEGSGDGTIDGDGDLDPLQGRKRRRQKPVEGNRKLRNRKKKMMMMKKDKDGYAIIEEEEEEEEMMISRELVTPTLDGSLAVKKKEESAMRARKRRRVMVDEMNESIMQHNTITDFGTLADLNKYGNFVSPSKKKKKKENMMKDEDDNDNDDEEEVEMNPPTQVITALNLDLGSSVSSSEEEEAPDRQDVQRLREYMVGAVGIMRNITSEKGKAEAKEILETVLKGLMEAGGVN